MQESKKVPPGVRRLQQEARRRSKANGTKYTAELRAVRKENGLDPTTGLPVE